MAEVDPETKSGSSCPGIEPNLPPFLSLSTELLVGIIRCLTEKDRLNLALTAKTFFGLVFSKEVSCDFYAPKEVYAAKRGVYRLLHFRLPERQEHVVSCTATTSYARMLTSAPCLQRLTVCSFSAGRLVDFSRMPNLVYLSVHSTSYTVRSKDLASCPFLEELRVGRFVPDGADMPALRRLTLTNTVDPPPQLEPKSFPLLESVSIASFSSANTPGGVDGRLLTALSDLRDRFPSLKRLHHLMGEESPSQNLMTVDHMQLEAYTKGVMEAIKSKLKRPSAAATKRTRKAKQVWPPPSSRHRYGGRDDYGWWDDDHFGYDNRYGDDHYRGYDDYDPRD